MACWAPIRVALVAVTVFPAGPVAMRARVARRPGLAAAPGLVVPADFSKATVVRLAVRVGQADLAAAAAAGPVVVVALAAAAALMAAPAAMVAAAGSAGSV